MGVLEIGVLIIILLIVQGIGLWVIFGRRSQVDTPSGAPDGLMLLQAQMQDLARTLDTRVAQSSKEMQESSHRQFSESSKLVKEITEELTSVKEISRQTQSFAEELKDLQDILKNPKQRGILASITSRPRLKTCCRPTGTRCSIHS
jgi:hypothetical protein